MNTKVISKVCFGLGFLSIAAAILVWSLSGGKEVGFEARTHGELFGIFVGLWAPTFFLLSICIARFADEKNE